MVRTPPERRTLLIDPDFNGAFLAGPTDFAWLRAGKDDAEKLKRLMQESIRESGLLPATRTTSHPPLSSVKCIPQILRKDGKASLL